MKGFRQSGNGRNCRCSAQGHPAGNVSLAAAMGKANSSRQPSSSFGVNPFFGARDRRGGLGMGRKQGMRQGSFGY